jgi:transposase
LATSSAFGFKTAVFYPYARRLRSDLQAVKHAFLLPYSNGVLEGQINRLKTIKRMMYGRAGLALLEKRVLYRCFWQLKNVPNGK